MLDFNLDAERQLPFDMALSVAFAASRGLNLWQVSGDEQNPFCPTTNTFVPQGCDGTRVPNTNPATKSRAAFCSRTGGFQTTVVPKRESYMALSDACGFPKPAPQVSHLHRG